MNGIQTLVRILEDYCDLKDRVIIYAQDWKMPDDGGIYILIKIIDSQTWGRESVPLKEGSKETASSKTRVAAEMIGRPHTLMDFDPRGRYFEMQLAPISQVGIDYIERNSVGVQTLGSAQDLTSVEGAGNLCRFRQEFIVWENVSKSSKGNFYETLGKTKVEAQE